MSCLRYLCHSLPRHPCVCSSSRGLCERIDAAAARALLLAARVHVQGCHGRIDVDLCPHDVRSLKQRRSSKSRLKSDRAAHLKPRHECLDGVGLALRQVSVLSGVCLEIEQHCHSATSASDNHDRKHELHRCGGTHWAWCAAVQAAPCPCSHRSAARGTAVAAARVPSACQRPQPRRMSRLVSTCPLPSSASSSRRPLC